MASLTLITPSGLRFWLVFCTFGSTPVREGSVFSVKFSANELSETSGVLLYPLLITSQTFTPKIRVQSGIILPARTTKINDRIQAKEW